MYPYDIFPGIDLYVIFLCVAIVAAMVAYRVMADRIGIGAKLQNLCIYTSVAAIMFGYFSAIFFQALYNVEKVGEFVIDLQTGATFYGGLIGGAGLFLLIYFVAGKRIFSNKEHIVRFFDVADAAACAISIAHAFGRLGCLMAGCCYGQRTDAWFGVHMDALGYKVVPTQLFEAIFLALIFVYLVIRIREKQTYCLQIYMILYGIWRFVIEFVRDDYRGTTLTDIVTPSQLTAILMILGGILLIVVQRRVRSAPQRMRESIESAEEYDEYDYDYEVAPKDEAAPDSVDGE